MTTSSWNKGRIIGQKRVAAKLRCPSRGCGCFPGLLCCDPKILQDVIDRRLIVAEMLNSIALRHPLPQLLKTDNGLTF
ncbi:Uncharacterised protein [Klebsiella pneumoniae]|nr:Uncharacterised protein [Klebsiella pneumoniae]